MSDVDQQPDLTAEFDAFYRNARDRLLLQAYALTGDLGAARSAVRDAFVVGWHHWRKISRLEDPEMSVRPHAWRTAQRRATARPWHREKKLDPDDRRTLDALAALTVPQRKTLLLTQLAAVSMPEVARELGMPTDQAERELQTAAAQFATQREIATSMIPVVFADLARATGRVTWPRVTIIRRAGAARRRMHTVLGAATVVAALVASGALVTDATGVRPTLDRESPSASSAASVDAGPEVTLPDTSLLPEETVREGLVGPWTATRTNDNSTGNGLVVPCQPDQQRYADPRGAAAWVRVFRNGPREESTRKLTQLAEASRTPLAARKAYQRLRGWVAGCATPGTRLVSTAVSDGVGDASAVFMLHSENPEDATYVVGVARTGLFTTAVSLSTDVGPGIADRKGIGDLLATAVDRLCLLADGGDCAADGTALTDVPAFPTGEVKAMLSPVDLPLIGEADEPWMGTPPRQITGSRTDVGVLGCDTPDLTADFEKSKFRTDLVRTFVKLESKLPPEFGLTQAVAALPKNAAGALVDSFRSTIARCPDRDSSAGTQVRLLERQDEGAESFSAWHLSTRLPGERTVEYDVAVIRSGSAISQLVFISAEGARMPDADFVALTRRALERLPYLPAYKR